MQSGLPWSPVRRLLGLSLIVMAVTAPHALATVHVVLFGGTLGQSYSPSSLSAMVGDTVRWQGNFSFHPLSSTTIPAGANPWHVASGSTFDYVITVAGAYSYQCDAHQPAMAGSFSAALTGVEGGSSGETPAGYLLEQNYPNPFNPTTVVRYQLPAASAVRLEVFDLLGRQVALLVDRQEGAGNHEVPFDARALASGVYEYRLTAQPGNVVDGRGFVQVRRMLLAR